MDRSGASRTGRLEGDTFLIFAYTLVISSSKVLLQDRAFINSYSNQLYLRGKDKEIVAEIKEEIANKTNEEEKLSNEEEKLSNEDEKLSNEDSEVEQEEGFIAKDEHDKKCD